MWYYVLRFIATAILLAILVYIGIRMAISTVAEEKAKYKKMIVDWVTSIALLYLLHYIIVFVIEVNTALIDMLTAVADETDMGIIIAGLLTTAVSPVSGIGGWAACILYVIFIWQTLKFFIMYAKRMITIGFLILISPLITITYSIDRAGDQKAQALNSWLKEFIYNVLIQPFHCILYLSFAQTAFKAVSFGNPDEVLTFFGRAVLVVLSSNQRNQSHQVASHVHQYGEDVVVVFFLIITCDKTQNKCEDENPEDEQGTDTRCE